MGDAVSLLGSCNHAKQCLLNVAAAVRETEGKKKTHENNGGEGRQDGVIRRGNDTVRGRGEIKTEPR